MTELKNFCFFKEIVSISVFLQTWQLSKQIPQEYFKSKYHISIPNFNFKAGTMFPVLIKQKIPKNIWFASKFLQMWRRFLKSSWPCLTKRLAKTKWFFRPNSPEYNSGANLYQQNATLPHQDRCESVRRTSSRWECCSDGDLRVQGRSQPSSSWLRIGCRPSGVRTTRRAHEIAREKSCRRRVWKKIFNCTQAFLTNQWRAVLKKTKNELIWPFLQTKKWIIVNEFVLNWKLFTISRFNSSNEKEYYLASIIVIDISINRLRANTTELLKLVSFSSDTIWSNGDSTKVWRPSDTKTSSLGKKMKDFLHTERRQGWGSSETAAVWNFQPRKSTRLHLKSADVQLDRNLTRDEDNRNSDPLDT